MIIYDFMHHKELYDEYIECNITGETKELLYQRVCREERTRSDKEYMDIVRMILVFLSLNVILSLVLQRAMMLQRAIHGSIYVVNKHPGTLLCYATRSMTTTKNHPIGTEFYLGRG